MPHGDDTVDVVVHVSAVDAMHALGYAWLDGELGKRWPRRRYVRDLAFIQASLYSARVHAAPNGEASIQVTRPWAAEWLAFLRDVRFPESDGVALQLGARAWNADRPRQWPPRPASFTL